MNDTVHVIKMNSTIAQTHYHFVTGRLAEAALRDIVGKVAAEVGFKYSIGVMPITVAALMTSKWLLRHLQPPTDCDIIVVPGYLAEATEEIAEAVQHQVLAGPKDLRQIPEFFGAKSQFQATLDTYDIRILAEINHAPRWSLEQLLAMAQRLKADGADVIDVGCDPGQRWTQVGDVIARLIDEGFEVSIDTFDPWEAAQACRRGASLVLSVNSQNRDAAVDWGCPVVVVPDTPGDDKTFFTNVEFLMSRGVSVCLDPILEPIGVGFTASLLRYARVRELYPDVEMLMGIGNLTELTDVDSAGVNLLLLAICQELQIRQVLTTQVINWAQTSVRECDLARRLVHYSHQNRVPPKRLSDALIMLRDPKLRPHAAEMLQSLANNVRDNHYRLFAQEGMMHVISANLHLQDTDPFRLFDQLLAQPGVDNLDASHAFYLGFELAKASLALQLGKQYEQDQALHWGYLTQEEKLHRIRRAPKRLRQEDADE